MNPNIPPYFDYLIAGFDHGDTGRFVHLGHWDNPASSETKLSPEEFELAQAKLNETLLNMAELHDGIDILDVGCGFGGTLETINNQYHDTQLVGVNIDPRQLEICEQLKSSHNNTYSWQQADACQLPFPDESFDRVLCFEAMFHFSSRRQFFLEVARILRPNGIMVASDITMQASRLNQEVPPHEIEAVIQKGYGPWPDFWGKDANHKELANDASLNCTQFYDATLNTYPSHLFTAPQSVSKPLKSGNSAMNAAVMLKWLHSHNVLQYLYMRFDKAQKENS